MKSSTFIKYHYSQKSKPTPIKKQTKANTRKIEGAFYDFLRVIFYSFCPLLAYTTSLESIDL